MKPVPKDARIILHPGPVRSDHDGQEHYVDAPRLAALYGVPLSRCIIQDYRREETYRGFYARKNDVHLYPRKGGGYERLELAT